MSLYQLQELASRHQEQIESTHRLIMNKEQKLNYLSSVRDSQQGSIFDYEQNLNLFKEKVSMQEARLRKLRLLKGQIQKQRCSNSNMCSEVETVKILFKEKERELSVAFAKIDALTRQLDELKKGNTANSYNINGYQHAAELDKLRQELLYKTKMCKKNEEELIFKRNMLYKRQANMHKIDQKINELQSRLTRKRQLNQQLSSQAANVPTQTQSHTNQDIDDVDLFTSKMLLRSSVGHPTVTYKMPYSKSANLTTNIATVEPLQRFKSSILKYDFPPPQQPSTSSQQHQQQHHQQPAVNLAVNKQDPKYQTLPYNTKFAVNRNFNGGNYSKVKILDDGSNTVSRNYSIISDECDNARMNGPTTNDISLIIKNDGGKDESLEERPSPSGSSGSSDRISSSMTAYSYNDKMHLNGHSSEKHYFNGMDKVDFRHNERLGGENGTNMLAPSSNQPSSYVPNNKTKNEVINQCNETSKSLDSFYKTKPSIPVKPIAATDEPPNDHLINDHSTRYDPNYLFTQRSHRSSSENSSLSTPSSGIYSSSDIFSQNGCSSLDKNDNDGSSLEDISSNSNDNYRNQAIEERSSVSEIVNKINNWSVSNGTLDWEKTKRRPVVSTNEMEKELNQEAQENGNYGDSGRQTIENGNQTRSYDIVQKEARKEEDVANNNDIDITTHESSPDRKETTKSKRMKGSLKNQDSNRKAKLPLGRRVSFDPLALLLDASLEGELELVKKTSIQVPNPSASNDEGITALHNATCAGHFDIVKYLVEIGCDVNVQDSDGWTPLHCAASCNNLVMIKFLVKSGACIFATTFSDHETAAEKCEEDEEGFDGCSQYLYGVQEQLGSIDNGKVYALYDYESQNSDELTFKCGDCLHVLRRGDDQEKEWWWSRLGNQEGYIPRNLIGMFPRIKA